MLVWQNGKLELKKEDAINPQAKDLANEYVPRILAMMGRGRSNPRDAAPGSPIPEPVDPFYAEAFDRMIGEENSEKARKNLAENGYQPDGLDQDDLNALAELPL